MSDHTKDTMHNLRLFGTRTLVLCPHTDDEFGCAGTIARLIAAGCTVRYLALSRCEESVPDGFPRDILEEECRKCLGSLGVSQENIEVLRFPVRYFPAHRQDILEHLVKLNREYRPTCVLVPSSFDNHQDHATVHAEGFRAFKHASLLGYELPQNVTSFDNTVFISLSEFDIEHKIKSLQSYESQRQRPYASAEFIRSLATVRGVQCGHRFAEAFEATRIIIGE